MCIRDSADAVTEENLESAVGFVKEFAQKTDVYKRQRLSTSEAINILSETAVENITGHKADEFLK